MPHNGLEKLEVLRIQNTHTLKTIPSVYAFQVSMVMVGVVDRLFVHFSMNNEITQGTWFAQISVEISLKTERTKVSTVIFMVHLFDLSFNNIFFALRIFSSLCLSLSLLLHNFVTYVFFREQNLRYAWLTHPFHCCAFKFPERHDPQRYAQREKYLAELHKKCMNNELVMDTKVMHDGNFVSSSTQLISSFFLIHASEYAHPFRQTNMCSISVN